MTDAGYRLIDHTADFGAEVWAPDAPELFRMAAAAMLELMFETRPQSGDLRRTLSIQGSDWADLMVNWLRELLFLVNGAAEVPARIEIGELQQTSLRAGVDCVRFDPRGHALQQEIKAVTYHQIEAGPAAGGGWRARIIFDV